MIRVAHENDILCCAGSEAAIRIVSAYEAYGSDTHFLQFFTDGDGTCMSLMDGVAVIHAPEGLDDEWLTFLNMHADVCSVRTDARVGEQLAALWHVDVKTGVFMTHSGEVVSVDADTNIAKYEDLYAFLCDHFSLPPFDSWYVDVSHRVRHGLCHTATLIEDGQVICNAMTVAETQQDALLGAVATHPEWRRRGLASLCIKKLISAMGNKTVHISPVDEYARRLYESLGFVVSGSFAELKRR